MHNPKFDTALSYYRDASDSWTRSHLVEELLDNLPAHDITAWANSTAGRESTMGAILLGDLADRAGDECTAHRHYTDAAQRGDFYGYVSLAAIENDKANLSEAIDFTRKAAELGDWESMICIGGYLKDQGHQDQAQAWWEKAAAVGVSKGMIYLGLMAEERQRVDEAIGWFRKAADAGNVLGMNILGNLLSENGETIEARLWYRKAAGLGDQNALENLNAFDQVG